MAISAAMAAAIQPIIEILIIATLTARQAMVAAILNDPKATLMAGSSALPAYPAAAITFIISAIFRLASIGSARLIPYWFIAVASISAAAVPSFFINLLVV